MTDHWDFFLFAGHDSIDECV